MDNNNFIFANFQIILEILLKISTKRDKTVNQKQINQTVNPKKM